MSVLLYLQYFIIILEKIVYSIIVKKRLTKTGQKWHAMISFRSLGNASVQYIMFTKKFKYLLEDLDLIIEKVQVHLCTCARLQMCFKSHSITIALQS